MKKWDGEFYKKKKIGGAGGVKEYRTNIGCLQISATHSPGALVNHSLSAPNILYNPCSSLVPLSTLILDLQTTG